MTTATDDVLSPLTLTRPLWDDPLTAALYAARATSPFKEKCSGARITSFSWNARNQLVGLSGPVPATFAYDGLGRRSGKTINGASTSVVFDGVDLVQELTATGTTNYLRSLNIDEALGRGNEFYLADALGSTLALADPTGALMTQYTYAPFGQTTTTGAVTSNPFTYTGQPDDATGLKFYRSRYYSPTLHRFLSEDPLDLASGDTNLYAYVGNNPVNFLDPFGLDKKDPEDNFALDLLPASIIGFHERMPFSLIPLHRLLRWESDSRLDSGASRQGPSALWHRSRQ